ncbi:hypothetical protein [Thalassotalea agarivorans]|uniref:Uncharacterized protein n=1 Tax=Thalassotalea agarivorans TaxID=349064 RepID=A0A1I0GI04_THASX|nr:hypothetical protein [Thalassotalea agarivorans]SET70526.1 hypothetical protein SAMN05660429_02441 [Thalassotalea agarivorans]
MPKYQIPKSPGEFEIVESKSGTPLIWNRKNGKGKVSIPCRNWSHAEEVLEKLNDLKKGGELWV